MKYTIILVLVIFSQFASADNERKERRDVRQEEHIETIDKKRDGGVIDKTEDVIDSDHEENEERRDDRRKDIKKK